MYSDQSALDLVALVGAPNVGKTTLYNWLTNSKFKTVNYPGATVEYAVGRSAERLEANCYFMDTPGTYSLFPKSSDEEVTLRALYDQHEQGQVKKIICVVDGSQLDRHLLLAEQIYLSGFPMVLVVTMADLLTKNNLKLNIEALEQKFNGPVVLFDGVLGGGLKELIQKMKELELTQPTKLPAWSHDQIQEKIEMIRELSSRVYGDADSKSVYKRTEQVDRWLLHQYFGLAFFFVIMSLLFSSIFWLAKPFMGMIDFSFTWLGNQAVALAPNSLLTDFLAHGLIASLGAVSVFAPQIFILFFGIGILESTGYLARAATLIDKPFSKLGLSGRSFVPILSGFACAVPAMMATRNISSKRDRMITNFIIPLMTCSARLPVYALLLSFAFKDAAAWKQGVALALLYLGSLFLGSLVAGILNKILAKSEMSLFMMELPIYRIPRWKILFHDSLSRTKTYLLRAGPVIFVFAVIIWAGTTFPNYSTENKSEKMESSYLGQVGRSIGPVFEPMGIDWRVGAGLLSAFAAREVFVSSMAIVFNVSGEDEESQAQGLLKSMKEAKLPNGQLLFTLASVSGLIVFFMIALQCMSTFSVAIKENGSWKFALIQLISFNVIGYILAVSVVQGFKSLGLG